MQEEEVGKNKILNIKEENYKKVIITKNGKFTIYSLFFDCNRFSTLNNLSKEDELELEKESKLSKMVDFCIKILRKNFISSNELRQKLNREIDDDNLDCEDYELEGYEDSKSIDRLDNKIQKIYICSPLRGNIEDNINKAKEYCKFVVAKMKAMPVCPHIYFTQFLDDNNELEREIGMDFGLRLLSECDRVIVFDNNGISEGMKKEIELANSINIPVGYWSSGVYDLL